MRTLTVAWRSSAVRARLGALLLPMWRPRGQGFRGLVGRWGELCAAMRWGKGRGGGGGKCRVGRFRLELQCQSHGDEGKGSGDT